MSWGDVPDAATHARSLILYKSRAVLALMRAFSAVPASRLLPALAARAKRNGGALAFFRALPAAPPALPGGGAELEAPEGAPLTTQQVGGLHVASGWLQKFFGVTRALLPHCDGGHETSHLRPS